MLLSNLSANLLKLGFTLLLCFHTNHAFVSPHHPALTDQTTRCGRHLTPDTHSALCHLMTKSNNNCIPIHDNIPNKHTQKISELSSRREMMQRLITGTLATSTATIFPKVSMASETSSNPEQQLDNELIEVYFGCGCFWHVQHEFINAEKTILNRSDSELTARAGYAGGGNAKIPQDGKVCYHNAAQISDYGSMGYAEVVRLLIPPSKLGAFVKEYCNLFDEKGNRPDQFGDRGLEYRNLVGIPGGVKSDYAKVLVETSMQSGDKLDFAKGKGNDPDAKGLAFVMDSSEYPFFVAEQYHQFHDGFNIGENYPNSYNGLAGKLAKEGTLGVSKCPNGLLGLGALGL